MLLLRLPGLLLLRLPERQFVALLFQLPPRFTRFLPISRHPGGIVAANSDCLNLLVLAWLMWAIMLCTESARCSILISSLAYSRSIIFNLLLKRRNVFPCIRTSPGNILNPRNGMPSETGASTVASALSLNFNLSLRNSSILDSREPSPCFERPKSSISSI